MILNRKYHQGEEVFMFGMKDHQIKSEINHRINTLCDVAVGILIISIFGLIPLTLSGCNTSSNEGYRIEPIVFSDREYNSYDDNSNNMEDPTTTDTDVLEENSMSELTEE